MSDDLAIGGPGTTTVLTTELEEEASRLHGLLWEIENCHRELVALDRVIGNGILNAADAPQSALRAEQAIDEATAALNSATQDCEVLARGVSDAAQHYEWADRFVGQLEQQLAARLGYLLGMVAPVLLALILPGALLAAGGTATFLASLPEKSRKALVASIGSWLKEKSGSLTDPRVVTAVRLSVMSADDAGAGFARLPPQVAAALGDEGLGLLGVDTSASVLAASAGAFGLLRETRVKVTRGESVHGIANARTMQERLNRIPSGPEQIRIDRYSTPGEPDRFEVYIAGTEDFSPITGSNPSDLTSNVSAMAGGSDGSGAGSYRAIEEAMDLAGISSTSRVTFTGYSQGGLIAAQLAASGDFATDGLVTVAAPAGQVAVPHVIPYLAIEHQDDLIPALGGTFSSSDPLIVSRRAFDGSPPSTEPVLPAHRLDHYRDTAELIDQSTNLRLAGVLRELSHARAESVTSTVFLAERVNP